MNFQHLEKLKGLIEKSDILNAQERTEWLGLLELMNDKQLLELEGILMANVPAEEKAKMAVAAPPIAPPVIAKPSTPSIAIKPPVAKAPEVNPPVHLGHILNMPKAAPTAIATAVKTAPKPAAKSGFLKKLSEILREKELPAGHTDKELDLPAPEIHTIKMKPAAQAEVKPAVLPPTPIKPPAQPIAATTDALGNKPAAAVTHIPKPVKSENTTASALGKQLMEKIAEEKAVKQRGLEKLPSRINVSGFMHNAPKATLPNEAAALPRAESSAQASTELGASAPLQAPHPIKPLQNNLPKKSLEKIEDIEKLNANDIRTFDSTQLAKSVQNLVKKYGLHEIIFRMEKSPLYAVYIGTGSEILSHEASFEELASQNPDKYLNREEFEATADLLRIIQAG